MSWPDVISELGGGLPAVVIAALAFVNWRLLSRNDALTDKIIEMSTEQTSAMNELARAIERSDGGS